MVVDLPQARLLAGLDHDELAHHAPILVEQQVAVIHIGPFRIGALAEALTASRTAAPWQKVRRENCFGHITPGSLDRGTSDTL